MRVFTTCQTCRHLLQIAYETQQTHITCPEPDDYMTRALALLQQAAHEGDDDVADAQARWIEQVDEAPPKLGEAAAIYASWGWPVFPCVPGGKVPATRNGFKDASTSKQTVVRWWQDNPSYNIGVATGHLFDAIDVDVPEGTQHWAVLRDSERMREAHGWSVTPSGGWHVLVEPEGNGNLTKVAPGVDYRGLGGYVVVPPSVINEHDGRRYRWAVRPSPVVMKTG